MSKNITIKITIFVLISFLVFIGCGYQIKYALNDQETPKAAKPIPIKMQVAPLKDSRNQVERDKDARDKLGQSDLSDYTYDSEFSGVVSDEISKMLVEHLNFAWLSPSQIRLASVSSQNIDDAALDKLSKEGVEGVISGELIRFYGYYDQDLGRKLLYAVPLGVASGLLLNWSFTTEEAQYEVYWYGPGLVVGYYLESLHSRHIEYSTVLRVTLTSTSTHQIIWEEDFDVTYSGEKSLPGINTEQRKFDVAMTSLRDAANSLVSSLSNNSDLIVQRKNQTDVELVRKERPVISMQQETAPIAAAIMRERGLRYGIIAGVNLATISGYNFGTASSLTGFSFGGRLSYRFSDLIGARSEIAYSMKGSKIEDSAPAGSMGTAFYNGTTNLSYIDIPIVGDLYPIEDLKLFTGPVFSLFLGGSWESDIRFEGPFPISSEHQSGNITSDDVNSLDVGILFGAGYTIQPVTIEARYSLGITDHTKSSTSNVKNNVIQIVIGVNL